MPMVKVGYINMYYEVHGEGEPLVLIMGLGGASNMCWLQVASFSREYKVVVFDNRGVGRTYKPDMPCSMAMLSDDAAGLLEALAIPSAHVYGLSLGGMIAQDLALRYPQRVRSLILGATSCGGAHAIAPSPETLQKLLNMAGLPPEEAARAGASLAFTPAFIEGNPGRIEVWAAKGMESPPSPDGFRRQAEAAHGL